MTAEPNTNMTTDQALAIVDAATEWADGSGVVYRYQETRAAVSVLTQEIERLTDALQRIAWHELTWKEARDLARAALARMEKP